MTTPQKVEEEIKNASNPREVYLKVFGVDPPADKGDVILSAFKEGVDISAGDVETLDPDNMNPAVDQLLLLFNRWRAEPSQERTHKLAYACIEAFLAGPFLIPGEWYESHVRFINDTVSYEHYFSGDTMLSICYWSCLYSRIFQKSLRDLFRAGPLGDYYFKSWVGDNYGNEEIAVHAVRTLPAGTFTERNGKFTRVKPFPRTNWPLLNDLYDASSKPGSNRVKLNNVMLASQGADLTPQQTVDVAESLMGVPQLEDRQNALAIISGTAQKKIDELNEKLAEEEKKNAELKQEMASQSNIVNIAIDQVEAKKAEVEDHAKANAAWEEEYSKQLAKNRELEMQNAQLKNVIDEVKKEPIPVKIEPSPVVEQFRAAYDELYDQAKAAVDERDKLIRDLKNNIRQREGLPPVQDPPPPPDDNVPTVGTGLINLAAGVPTDKQQVAAIINEAADPTKSTPPQLGKLRELVELRGKDVPSISELNDMMSSPGAATQLVKQEKPTQFSYSTAPQPVLKPIVPSDKPKSRLISTAEFRAMAKKQDVPTKTVDFRDALQKIESVYTPISALPETEQFYMDFKTPTNTIVIDRQSASTPFVTAKTEQIAAPSVPVPALPKASLVTAVPTPVATVKSPIAPLIVPTPSPTVVAPMAQRWGRVDFDGRLAARMAAPLPPYNYVELAENPILKTPPVALEAPQTTVPITPVTTEMEKAVSIAEEWWRRHPHAMRADLRRTAKNVVTSAADYIPSRNDFLGVDTKK